MTMSPGERHPWDLGASDEGVVVGEYLAGTFRVVGLGPAAGHRSLDPQLAEVARGLLHQELRGAVPLDQPVEELRRLVRRVDRGIRSEMPEGNAARATMVCAVVSDGKLWCAHTGEGSAYRLRGDELTCLVRALPDSLAVRAQRSRMSRSASRGLLGRHQRLNPGDVPWIGPRMEGDERQPVMIRVNDEPVELEQGDRILLCTTPPGELEHVRGLAKLVGEGLPDLAAQAICNVLAMRDGLGDVAVAVVDWESGGVQVQRNTSIDSLGSELFADFEDLVREITDELDIEPPTPPPAPTRGTFDPDAKTDNSELNEPDPVEPSDPLQQDPEPPPVSSPTEVTEPIEVTEPTEPTEPVEPDSTHPDPMTTEPHPVPPTNVPAVEADAPPASTGMGGAVPLVVGAGALALLGLVAGTAIAFAFL